MRINHLELARSIRRSFRSPMPNYQSYQSLLRDKTGLEIGGPSELFRRILPVYEVAASIDGVNFSVNTMWEGHLVDGQPYKYMNGKAGRQYICEATDLRNISANCYDFVLSSNNLEHIANPLKAVKEWLRILRPGGYLLLVLPRKESNFDRKREISSFEHLLDDLNNDTSEHDLTHLQEILDHHDYSMDPPLLRRLLSIATFRGFRPAINQDTMRQRGLANFKNRGLHHHVFDQDLLETIFKYFDMTPLIRTSTSIDHVAIAQKF